MAVMLVFYVALLPFAAMPVPQLAGFIPTLEGMMSVAEFVTAVFLFSQFSVGRSRELLVLAIGYLFSALTIFIHLLTFPGAFAPFRFPGAGPESAPWIYFFWHLGFPAAIIGYVYLKNGKLAGRPIRQSTLFAVGWSALVVTGLACALMWLVTAGKDLLPSVLNGIMFTPLAHYLAGFDLLITVLALLFLWTHRASVLDQWLMVALCALVAELALLTFFLEARFSVGFYAARLFSVVSATVVLAALLAGMAGLHARVSDTLMSLQRERESKLLSLQAIGSAIAHELNQPIAAIAWEGSTALKLLKAPPNLEEVRVSLDAIISEAFRASEALSAIRELFKDKNQEGQAVDGNAVVMEALHVVREELKAHAVMAQTELTPDLPHITGHKGQLLQVFLNLLQNAIEALDSVKDRDRIVRIATSRHGNDKISITMEDTGPGIGPELVGKVFDTFVTTKPTGTGLGLSLCRMIVERHGGDIMASSSGSGARFQVTLPASNSVVAASA